MSALPLEARIRWNRLRIMGALVHVEQDLGVAERHYRNVRRLLRWSAPALAAAGIAWSVYSRKRVHRGSRLLNFILGARSAFAMARALRTASRFPSH